MIYPTHKRQTRIAGAIKFVVVLAIVSFNLDVAAKPKFTVPPKPAFVMENYCFSCHDEDTQKGDIRLDQLGEQDLASRLELLNRVQEQLFIRAMPPETKKKQPSEEQWRTLALWVNAELKTHNASKLKEKLRYPSYGNYVDHNKLFSGVIKAKAATPKRRWLVSPQIFNSRVAEIFDIRGEKAQKPFYGVTNPIILPDRSGVRYYDNTALDGGHLLVMLTNAEWISRKQIHPARVKKGEIKANDFPNPKDRWAPRQTPEAFETIIMKDSAPSEKEIVAAIQAQFGQVLRREANDQELDEYSRLIESAIELAGNTEGLRQMLVSVILESEFLYRLEFGEGAEDSAGRKQLSAREASYAIAYAISDESPDAELIAAANDGKLETKADYQREVTRLLNDKKSFYAEGAPSLSGKNLKSHKVTHPKINRFFREFFGYPNMVKIFKDGPTQRRVLPQRRAGGLPAHQGR